MSVGLEELVVAAVGVDMVVYVGSTWTPWREVEGKGESRRLGRGLYETGRYGGVDLNADMCLHAGVLSECQEEGWKVEAYVPTTFYMK